MKDKEYIDTPEDFINEVQRKQEALEPAVDDMRQKFNEVIAARQLTADGVVIVLAKLSAAWIHKLQQQFDIPGASDAIRESFLENFHTLLKAFEIADKQKEERKDWN